MQDTALRALLFKPNGKLDEVKVESLEKYQKIIGVSLERVKVPVQFPYNVYVDQKGKRRKRERNVVLESIIQRNSDGDDNAFFCIHGPALILSRSTVPGNNEADKSVTTAQIEFWCCQKRMSMLEHWTSRMEFPFGVCW